MYFTFVKEILLKYYLHKCVLGLRPFIMMKPKVYFFYSIIISQVIKLLLINGIWLNIFGYARFRLKFVLKTLSIFQKYYRSCWGSKIVHFFCFLNKHCQKRNIINPFPFLICLIRKFSQKN